MIHLLRSPRKWAAALSLLLRVGVGGFFIYASLAKIDAPEVFVRNVRGYQLLDAALVPTLAYTLPWLEFVCGTLLILGIWLPEARALTMGMLLVFIGAIGSAVARGLDIDCGCTGSRSSKVGWPLILLDAAMFAALIADAILLRLSRPGTRLRLDHPGIPGRLLFQQPADDRSPHGT